MPGGNDKASEDHPIWPSERRRSKPLWMKFSLGGLFTVVTIVSAKLAIESYEWRKYEVEMTVSVLAPMPPEIQKAIHRDLLAVNGVVGVSVHDQVIKVRLRRKAYWFGVLERLGEHDVEVKELEFEPGNRAPPPVS